MPKPKLYFQSDIPATVTEIVRAMCADYPRRSRAIQFENIPNAVKIRYIELNSIIDTALESVEIGIRKDLLLHRPRSAYLRIHIIDVKRNLSMI